MRNGDTFHRIPLFFFFKARHVKARIDPHPSEATEVTDKPLPLPSYLSENNVRLQWSQDSVEKSLFV